AAVGLLVTRGFEDLLELGRVKMTELFDLNAIRRPPLVRRNWVQGVDERMSATGAVLKPLDRRQLLRAAKKLVDQGAEALAILFLHTHRNRRHEDEAKA